MEEVCAREHAVEVERIFAEAGKCGMLPCVDDVRAAARVAAFGEVHPHAVTLRDDVRRPDAEPFKMVEGGLPQRTLREGGEIFRLVPESVQAGEHVGFRPAVAGVEGAARAYGVRRRGQAEQDLSVCDDLFHRDLSLLSPVLPHILLRQTSA